MISSSSLKATAVASTAVVAVLSATAEAAGSDYIPTPATPSFFLSPSFLWVTANVIVVWLLISSSRRRGKAAANDVDDTSASHDGGGELVVPGAVDSFYASSSEYDAFSDAAAPVSSKGLSREARAAARRSDRPRVRKKPAGLDAPPKTPRAATVVAAEARDDELAGNKRRGRGQEETAAVAVAAAVADDDDVSMDSLWESILQRRAARPVVVRKSESWSNEEMPRLQRVAETAAAVRRHQVRKSVSAVAKASAAAAAEAPTTQPPPEPTPAARQTGWRTRDVLVSISPDELLRRAESFIRRQHEHLRLQRQESEQRQLLLQRRLHAPAPAPLIRAS